MAEFVLPCGRVVLLDDADLHIMEGRRWFSARRGLVWYVDGRLPGERSGILLHTLLTGWARVDHQDRNGLNNRRSNLRPCTQQQNRMNTVAKTGKRFKGVFPARDKFYAMIGKNGVYYRSRGHLTPESAAHAYDQMATRLHGEFARLNFPNEGDVALHMLDRKDARQAELCL
ncbi:MAG: hypothetical protein BGO05_18585 [Rhizobiales bacterium 63-7]|nr:HNH endonuclease [Hyphomicrobiales bacterium]OJU65895.1 MAG: hypothetical protein BGO05_18585 [Rhizobiales bacterium 63-7]